MRIFITGTDTGIGKTYVSVQLLNVFHQMNLSSIAIKPVATGCDHFQNRLFHPDALLLQQHASISLPYSYINPIAFKLPIAPHIHAKKNNLILSVQSIMNLIQPALNYPADIYLIEGAGGLCVPFNLKESWIDFIRAVNANIILVIGIKLGCLNHSILTYEKIKQSQLPFIGWIANCIDPHMSYTADNIKTLEQWLGEQPLDIISYRGTFNKSFSFC